MQARDRSKTSGASKNLESVTGYVLFYQQSLKRQAILPVL